MVTDSYMHRFPVKWRFLSKGAMEVSLMQLEPALKKYFGYEYVFPLAQGRMAESVFIHSILAREGLVPNNGLFITTRSHLELQGLESVEIPVLSDELPGGKDIFAGNMDIAKLKELMGKPGSGHNIACIYMECCNNANGGYPVSMQNIREVYQLAVKGNIMLILDPTRILENACFIHKHEETFKHTPLLEIVREFCSYSHGCTMSLTKDFQMEKGAFIGVRDTRMAVKLKQEVMRRGDGLSIRDKATICKALKAGLKNTSQVYKRLASVKRLHAHLLHNGIPLLTPATGHAVYLDAASLKAGTGDNRFALRSFLAFLYTQSGIAGSENYCTPMQTSMGMRLIRFAIPRSALSREQCYRIAQKIARAWRNRMKMHDLEPAEMGEHGEDHFIKFKPVQDAG